LFSHIGITYRLRLVRVWRDYESVASRETIVKFQIMRELNHVRTPYLLVAAFIEHVMFEHGNSIFH
jgi:hypothetical protein